MARDDVDDLVEGLIDGRVSRQQFLARALALGLSVTAIGSILAAHGEAFAATSTSGVAGLPWPKVAVPEPSSKVTLSVANAWDPETWARQKQFDKLFMQRHPNIVVKAENTPWVNFLQKYEAQAAGGTLPDVMYVHFSWAQNLIKQGFIIALDGYIARQHDFNLGDFTKPSLISYRNRKDGKLYGLPYDEDPGVLFYNKGIFDKAHVQYPTEHWTLDDLKKTAIKLTRGKGAEKVFGFGGAFLSAGNAGLAPPFLFPFGAQYTNAAQTKCLIDSPAAVKAMEWWIELQFKYGAMPTPAELRTMQQDPFMLGRVAMDLNGAWYTRSLVISSNVRWGMTMWPRGPKAHVTFSEGSAYAITSQSQQKDASWIYLNEYTSGAGQAFMGGIPAIFTPARKSAWPALSKGLLARYKDPTLPRVVEESELKFASHQVIDNPGAPQEMQKAGAIWDLVTNRKMSVKEALHQICQTIDPLLAANAT